MHGFQRMTKLLHWTIFITTFAFLDYPLERIMKYFLHKNRLQDIENTIARIPDEQARQDPQNQFRLDVEREDRRVYHIVDNSILRANIVQARQKFLQTIILASLILILLYKFYELSEYIFVMPLSIAVINWFNTISTIHVPYKGRVIGAMDSVVGEYLYQQSKKQNTTSKIIQSLEATTEQVFSLNRQNQIESQITCTLAHDPRINHSSEIVTNGAQLRDFKNDSDSETVIDIISLEREDDDGQNPRQTPFVS